METVEIIEGVEAIGPAIWIPEKKILAIGDVHMGYEEALSDQGFIVPRVQFKESVKILEDIFKKVKPETIVINGDLKHEFGTISDQEWLDTSKFLDIIITNCRKVILVKGNHDTILGPIAKRKKLKIVDHYCVELNKKEIESKSILEKIFNTNKTVNNVCFIHGDKISEVDEVNKADLLIIGHEHPAVVLREGVKSEKYKCFLLGKWKRQKLIAMPSFLPTIEGTNVKQEKLLSPYLHQDLDNFEVFAVGDKVYKFGRLKNL